MPLYYDKDGNPILQYDSQVPFSQRWKRQDEHVLPNVREPFEDFDVRDWYHSGQDINQLLNAVGLRTNRTFTDEELSQGIQNDLSPEAVENLLSFYNQQFLTAKEEGKSEESSYRFLLGQSRIGQTIENALTEKADRLTDRLPEISGQYNRVLQEIEARNTMLSDPELNKFTHPAETRYELNDLHKQRRRLKDQFTSNIRALNDTNYGLENLRPTETGTVTRRMKDYLEAAGAQDYEAIRRLERLNPSVAEALKRSNSGVYRELIDARNFQDKFNLYGLIASGAFGSPENSGDVLLGNTALAGRHVRIKGVVDPSQWIADSTGWKPVGSVAPIYGPLPFYQGTLAHEVPPSQKLLPIRTNRVNQIGYEVVPTNVVSRNLDQFQLKFTGINPNENRDLLNVFRTSVGNRRDDPIIKWVGDSGLNRAIEVQNAQESIYARYSNLIRTRVGEATSNMDNIVHGPFHPDRLAQNPRSMAEELLGSAYSSRRYLGNESNRSTQKAYRRQLEELNGAPPSTFDAQTRKTLIGMAPELADFDWEHSSFGDFQKRYLGNGKYRDTQEPYRRQLAHLRGASPRTFDAQTRDILIKTVPKLQDFDWQHGSFKEFQDIVRQAFKKENLAVDDVSFAAQIQSEQTRVRETARQSRNIYLRDAAHEVRMNTAFSGGTTPRPFSDSGTDELDRGYMESRASAHAAQLATLRAQSEVYGSDKEMGALARSILKKNPTQPDLYGQIEARIQSQRRRIQQSLEAAEQEVTYGKTGLDKIAKLQEQLDNEQNPLRRAALDYQIRQIPRNDYRNLVEQYITESGPAIRAAVFQQNRLLDDPYVKSTYFVNPLAEKFERIEKKRRAKDWRKMSTETIESQVNSTLVEHLTDAQAMIAQNMNPIEYVRKRHQLLSEAREERQGQQLRQQMARGVSPLQEVTEPIIEFPKAFPATTKQFNKDLADIYGLPEDYMPNAHAAYSEFASHVGEIVQVNHPDLIANMRQLGMQDDLIPMILKSFEMQGVPNAGPRSEDPDYRLGKFKAEFELMSGIDDDVKAKQYAALHMDSMLRAWNNDPVLRELLPNDGEPLSVQARNQLLAQAQMHLSTKAPATIDQEYQYTKFVPERSANLDLNELALHYYEPLIQDYSSHSDIQAAIEDTDYIRENITPHTLSIAEDIDRFPSEAQGGVLRPVENTRSTIISGVSHFMNKGGNNYNIGVPNTVTERRLQENMAILSHYFNWLSPEHLSRTNRKSSLYGRLISDTSTANRPIVGDERLPADALNDTLAELDTALQQRGTSLQQAQEVSNLFNGKGIRLDPSELNMTPEEMDEARAILGLSEHDKFLNAPLAMGNVVNVGAEYNPRMGHLFGMMAFENRGDLSTMRRIAEDMQLGDQLTEHMSGADVINLILQNTGLDFRAGATTGKMADFIAERMSALKDEKVRPILGPRQRTRIAEIIDRGSGHRVEDDLQTEEELGKAADERNKTRIVEDTYKRINVKTIKDLWSKNRGFRYGAVGVGAFGLWGELRIRKDKERTRQDMQGPPHLPGGNPYIDDSPPPRPEPMHSTNTSPAANNFPGVTYRVRAGGKIDPEALRARMQKMTGVEVSGSAYNESGYQSQEDYSQQVMNQYGNGQ